MSVNPVQMVKGLVAGLLLTGFASTAVVAEDDPRAHLKGSQAYSEAQCVEPTEDIRRNHMKYLNHQRDLTMHKGIRTKQHSLANCIGCHVKTDEAGQYVPINDEGQFCAACHEFSSVNIDCFQCHATVPRPGPGHKASMSTRGQ